MLRNRDRFPLTGQVPTVSDRSRQGGARLAGVEAPGMEDNEPSVAELTDPIHRMIAWIKAVPKEAVAGGGMTFDGWFFQRMILPPQAVRAWGWGSPWIRQC